MSIRWRFLGAFILIIVLAVSLSVAVGYVTTQGQLQAFVGELSRDEANNLAQSLSQAYTSSGSWDTVDVALAETGYLYTNEGAEHAEGGEGKGEGAEEGAEFFHLDRIRVVVVDIEGHVVQDNFSQLASGAVAPDLDGQRTPIMDLGTKQPVGYAYVDVNHEFLATESLGFLRGLLYRSAIGGLLIAVIAFLLALWLSRRITAPVIALTQATQAIAQHGETAPLPVTTSDELGQMSAAFNQMTTALQTQRDLRKRLINDLSHELNTPLSVIQLEAYGLRKGLQTPTRAAEAVIQEVNTLRNLVRDLNWLAETDSGEQPLTLEPSSIEELLATEVERWQAQAQAHDISLSLQVLPELPTLHLDQMRMSQALGNVIRNALQHTEASTNGQVTVSATIDMDNWVSISIKDNGAGIEPADLRHIFDRFYRTDQSRSRHTGGTGLGLAIARAIIDAHDGKIMISSGGLGKGTTVSFDLPLD